MIMLNQIEIGSDYYLFCFASVSRLNKTGKDIELQYRTNRTLTATHINAWIAECLARRVPDLRSPLRTFCTVTRVSYTSTALTCIGQHV